MIYIALATAFLALIIGSITDIQKREVHDYVSFSLIFLSFGYSIIYSVMALDWHIILETSLGFMLGLIIAYAMFYLGQWGGGDSKLIMGLGAAIGFNPIFSPLNLWFIAFLGLLIFSGAIYGLAWSIYLAIRYRKIFSKNLKELTHTREVLIIRRFLLAFTIIGCVLTILLIPLSIQFIVLLFIAMIFMIFYLWLFVRVVEDSCMIKDIPISKLTEGDWIYKDVFIDGKYITGPKDLGISKPQIKKLLKFEKLRKIKNIKIKEGIPFIPAFLLAFILTAILYMLRDQLPLYRFF